MTSKRAVIENTILQAHLTPNCQAVADYWLSLWDGDALCLRENFQPTKLGPLLKNIVLFDVVPDASVHVRLAGSGINAMLGMELTGADWLALADDDRRAERLSMVSAIARGAIAYGTRTIELICEQQLTFPELMLPFASRTIGKPAQVLYFADWFPDNPATIVASRKASLRGVPVSYRVIELQDA